MPKKITAAKAPKKTRVKKGYSEKDKVFLRALAASGNVTKACEESGHDRVWMYQRRDRDPEFAAEWERAKAYGVCGLEDEARRRAFDGWDEPVFHKGEATGVIRKFSDTLLIFLLKAARPEVYRDNSRVEVAGDGGGPLTIEVVDFRAAYQAQIATGGDVDGD
jgi:hypothetical protein